MTESPISKNIPSLNGLNAMIPAGVLPFTDLAPREKARPLSIDEMLSWQPNAILMRLFSLIPSTITISPTPHALSQAGTHEDRVVMYQDMQNFLSDPNIAPRLAAHFHVAAKAFRNRPPLKIVADSRDGVTGIQDRYLEKVFKMPTTTHYFVLENERDPLAFIGFNQFSDGIEIRNVQAVHTDKIGESAKDFDRLGHGLEKLVALVEIYAAYRGMKYCMILPAKENVWVDSKSFPLERAQKIYDDMARRREYEYNPKLKRYIKVFDDGE